jgi:hypothetical protein
MTNMELATAIVISPKAAFESLAQKPRFIFPMLLIAIGSAVVLGWYFAIVDFPWMMDRIFSANKAMTEAQRDQAARFMSRAAMGGLSVVSGLIVAIIVPVIQSVYYLLASKIKNVERSFDQWLALAAWASFPGLIGILASVAFLATTSSTKIGNEEIVILSLNELFFHLPLGHKGTTFLASITILHPWTWYLATLGVKTYTGRSWLFSSLFVLLPVVLYYGIFAAISFR